MEVDGGSDETGRTVSADAATAEKEEEKPKKKKTISVEKVSFSNTFFMCPMLSLKKSHHHVCVFRKRRRFTNVK